MLAFLFKIWGLAKPYRWRFILGIVAGILSGAVAPLMVGTIMFVYGAIFPSGNISNAYTMTNNVVIWPPITIAKQGSASFTVTLTSATNDLSGNSAISSPESLQTNLSFLFLQSDSAVHPGYTIVVTNSGSLALSNIVLYNVFPTNLVLNSTASAMRLPVNGLPQFVQKWYGNVRMSLENGLRSHRWAVILLIAAIPFTVLLRGIFGYLNVYFLQWVATRTVADLRSKLFSHLTNLSASFYNRNSSGQLISRVVNDTGSLQNILSNATSVIIRDPITLITLFLFLLRQNAKLTLISMIVLPLAIVPIAIFSRKVRRATREMQGRSAELTQIMTETFTGHRVIKAYNLEKVVGEQFFLTTRRTIGHLMRIVRAAELPGTFIEFFGAIGFALLLLYFLVQPGSHPSATDFLGLIISISMMYQPMKNLTRLQNQIVQARAASDRAFALLAVENAIPEPVNPKPLKAVGADIEFENLHFAYGEKNALHDINLKIKAGQLVALVGASGSGKTTLSNLLLRFYDPQQGSVKIGGTDIREFSTRDLRSQMAVVTQETVLFNDTIRRNIELGRPGATQEEIIAAAKSAHAHQFIMEKEKGYDTVVGEKGVMLSGGQRQRLAIARAVLRNAPILILDEATNALDTESERAVQTALDELMKGKTTLCIAHRLSTILHADLIVVLDQGKIVETGKHDELIHRGGVYQKLYQMQFRE